MEYFFYSRDKPGTLVERMRVVESHWAFMDNYAEGMIARGPTLTSDGVIPTGSMHIVDLQDAAAARVFAFEEPTFRAGVFADVMVRRWHNVIGRKMWDFRSTAHANHRFLIIAHGRFGSNTTDALKKSFDGYVLENHYQGRLILGGPLLTDDGQNWLGTAMLVELPSRMKVEVLQTEDPYNQADLYQEIEIHRWRFGGRPDEDR
ncbi:YciI family protein [Devosia sp. UYZn731]|uniref:YciI family protein n=1 Tax=Devosia sp. UYZn731 TaxID=3156345 RepID=UPI0033911312